MELLSKVDVGILTAYCITKCIVKDVSSLINGVGEFSGLLIPGAAGANVPNPLIAIRSRAMNDMVSYAIQMGMTPAARILG